MLKKLKINNYAIIESLELDFYEGMTVLTGETGAGKSIIVDAISLLLGERASRDMISSKAEEASVTGVFTLDNASLKTLLKNNEIDYDDIIEIHRTISKDNRNIVKINNQNSSIKVLKELAIYIADIHSQFDTNRLINPYNYLALIDNFRKDKVSGYINDYQRNLSVYSDSIKVYKDLIKAKDNTLRQLDLYQFQFKELAGLNLDLEEENDLTEQINLMENMDKINTVLEKFNSTVNEQNVLDNLYLLKNDLITISDTSNDFQDLSNRLNDLYFELDDIQQSLNDKLNNLDYNQKDYDSMIVRLHQLEKVKQKYNKSIEELISYREYLSNEIDKVENYDSLISEAEAEVEHEYGLLLDTAIRLRNFRKDLAKKITKELKETLNDLVILNADFEIRFSDDMPKNIFDTTFFNEDGIDNIDFYISTNIGEPLKQLSKTASGGEMSRVMLAFKSIFVRSNQISTIIFDEIDTGISGYIAKKIANKIQEISKISQVISITHIPQVVATGKNHISVRKHIKDKQTKITVKYLDYQERVEEIAKMISADKLTSASMESAKELLISE